MHHPSVFIYTLQPGNYNYRRFEFNFTPKKSFFSREQQWSSFSAAGNVVIILLLCVDFFINAMTSTFSHIDSFTQLFLFFPEKETLMM